MAYNCKRPPVSILLFLIFFLWCGNFPAFADSVDIYGVPFEVDSLREVQGKSDTYELSIGGEVALVSEGQLYSHIVQTVLSKPDSRFNLNSLQELYSGAAAAGDRTVAVLALNSLLQNNEIEEGEASLVVGKLCSSSSFTLCANVLEKGNLQSYNQFLLTELVLQLAATNPKAISPHLSKLGFLFGSQFKKRLEELFDNALISGKTEEVINSCVVIFGNAHTLCKSLREREQLIIGVLSGILAGEFEELQQLERKAALDADFERRIGPLVRQQLYRRAGALIAKGNKAGALEALSYLNVSWATAETQTLTGEILSDITPDEFLKASLRTRNFLEKLQERNPELHKAYREKLKESFFTFLNDERLKDADALLTRLLLLQDDPDAENDELRFHLAMSYAAEGNQVRAKELIAEMGTSLSLLQRMTLVTSGLYVNRAVLLLVIVSPFLGVLIWYLLRRSRRPAPVKPVTSAYRDDEEDDDLPLFSSRTMMRLDPRAEEYKRHLSMLGLEPGCDIKSIKSAYRRAVKELHPDRRKAMDPDTTRRFHDLQKAYENIIEIRKEMGLP